MPRRKWSRLAVLVVVPIAAGCDLGAKDSVQYGYRGTGIAQTSDRSQTQATLASLKLPAPIPPAGASPPGPLPWKNVQVLNDVSVGEFNRTMIAMSRWVAGGDGNCTTCHIATDMASDSLYQKRVARAMLRMTREINSTYANHVQATGVTCYTCHQGNAQPNGYWFFSDQNQYLRYYLDRPDARIQSHTVEPTAGNRSSIKQAEWTYSLMTHFSRSLGVNCTYCHNSRQWSDWSQSPEQRETAWHGIRMVRQLNNEWLTPLTEEFPPNRLGPLGDGPKLNCATCHQGAYKPLLGTSMLPDYPELAKAVPQPPKPAKAADAATGVAGAAP